jgi:DNA-binding transcriptional regulator YhcF (GntR family)
VKDPDEEVRDGIPAFVHVYDRLRELIARDGLEPGELMPNESALAGELSVSREIVREALLLLEEDGHVARASDWRWRVAREREQASITDPFPQLLGGGITAERRIHAALERGSSWSRELLASEEMFLVWETVFSYQNVLLASTLEVMLESALPEGLADADPFDVAARPTLLGCVPRERRAEMTVDLWRFTPLSRNTERLSWMDLPMHGIPVGLTVVFGEAGRRTYLAKNAFDLGTFTLFGG